jgi:hypothetical protein
VLTTLLVASTLLALGGVSIAFFAFQGDDDRPTSGFVDMRPQTRGKELGDLLTRRADAVRKKDKTAFLAGLDTSDPAFVKRETLLYDNLTKIPFAKFELKLEPVRKDLQAFLPNNIREKYHGMLHVGAVTIVYQIEGVDTKAVSTPWSPVFVMSGGHWKIGAEVTDKGLPYGENGQPWDAAGPITVLRGKRVVAVLSADDSARGPSLLDLAERGLDRLAKTRSGGWDGKVFVTAVQDQRIFDTYFADSPERIKQVAAIAVPYYTGVPDWSGNVAYATTRIVFNPKELSAQPEALQHDLTHEFTHAAMGPVTTGYTPRWLVEGFAEFAAYNAEPKVPADAVKRALGSLDVSAGLPTDKAFYDEPRNYIGAWLANKMIAEKYGQAKLIALYEDFQKTTSIDVAVKETLGVEKAALDKQWQQYVDNARK